MANISINTTSFIDGILPVYGNPRCNIPVWNEGEKMFISDEYQSDKGNCYYKGLRFSDRLAIVEKVGLFHNWKYIDEIEVYTFNQKSRTLIGSHKFEKTFYDKDLIQNKAKEMVSDYITSQMKLQNLPVRRDSIVSEVDKIVGATYVSLLSDDYNINLQNLLPVLQTEN